MPSLQDFKEYINQNGISKKYRYNLILTLPDPLRGLLAIEDKNKSASESFFGGFFRGLADGVLGTDLVGSKENSKTSNFLNIACLDIQIPPVNVSTSEFRQRKFAYRVDHQPFTATFMLSDGLQEKAFFDSWINIINDPNSRRTEFLDNYAAFARIESITDFNGKYKIDISDCFPTSTSSIELNRTSTSEYNTFSVTFDYRKAIRSSPLVSSTSSANGLIGAVTAIAGLFSSNNSNSFGSDTPSYSNNTASANALNNSASNYESGSTEEGYINTASSIVSSNSGNVSTETSDQMLSNLQEDVNNNDTLSDEAKESVVNDIDEGKGLLGKN